MTRNSTLLSAIRELISRAEECYCKLQFAQAADLYVRALELSPNNPDLCFSAGNAFRKKNDFEQAAGMYLRAVRMRPDFFAAQCNLAAAFRELGRLDDAIAPLEKAVTLMPGSIEVMMQLADLYLRRSNVEKAMKLLSEVVELKPDCAEALNGLGNCAMNQNDLNAAVKYYLEALKVRHDYADAHYNLGIIMRQLERLDEAVTCFKNAVFFMPGAALPLVNLGEAYQILGEIDRSEEYFSKSLLIDQDCRPAYQNLLISMQYNPRYDAQTVIDAHRQWGTRLSSRQCIELLNDRSIDRRLVVGYLSPDFCRHPAAAFLEPIIQRHNRTNFEIRCYSETVHIDDMTERFRTLASCWKSIEKMSDVEVADLIRSDRVDLLVDTAGHLRGNRLGVFALRAAPLQISAIGYPGPTGCTAIDYRISDAVIDPPMEETTSTDKPLRISKGFCCYLPPQNMPPINDLPALNNGFLTFGSLHKTARLNEYVIKLWSSVLRAVDSSRLIIFRNTLAPSVVARLSEWFLKEKIELSRIDFRSTVPSTGHLNVYNEIDISLDTFPWSGHTTACESLIMGVPVITLRGDRHAGRMVSSILNTTGLMQYIASSYDEFVTIASYAASNIAGLASLRSQLRQKVLSSPLCDAEGYVSELEDHYRNIWKKWCEKV